MPHLNHGASSSENFPKHPNHLSKRQICSLRIKSWSFIPSKRMFRRIQQCPIPHFASLQRPVNRRPSCLRHMRIRAPKNHQQLPANLLHPRQSSRIRIPPQLPIMNSRTVVTRRRPHFPLKRRSQCQVPSDTKPQRSNLPRRHFVMFRQPIQPRSTICIKIRHRSLRRILLPPRSPRIVKRDRRSRRLNPPVNLRRRGHKSVSRQSHASPQHRRRKLKNIRVAPDPRILPLRFRCRHERPHRPTRQRNIHIFRSNNHFPTTFIAPRPAISSGGLSYPIQLPVNSCKFLPRSPSIENDNSSLDRRLPTLDHPLRP